MKHGILPLAILTVISLSGCGHNDNGKAELTHHHDHAHAHHDHESAHHDQDADEDHDEHEADSDEITLNPATAKKMGVVVETIKPTSFHEIIKVSGQLQLPADGSATASATASGILTLAKGVQPGAAVRAGQSIASISSKGIAGGDTNAAALATLQATKRELDRLTPLHAEGLVTTSDYNAALEAYRVAQANYSGRASGGGASSPISGVVTEVLVNSGQYVEVGQPVAIVGKTNRLSLKADLPSRFRDYIPRITSANFRSLSSDIVYNVNELYGKLLSTASAATQGGYTPVYFLIDKTDGLLPGESVEVFLAGNPRDNVLAIPMDAIVEQQGNHYAYVQLDEECYEKRLVKLGANDGRRVEVRDGLHAGDKVVVKGATVVKLAESSGTVPEGHSHSH